MGMKMAKLSDLNLLDVGNTLQMAGAIYTGNGKMYLAMFPEEHGVLDAGGNDPWFGPDNDPESSNESYVEVLNMDQDEWATFIRQTDLLETEALVRAADGTIQKAILRKSQRQIEQGVSWRVFKRDGYKCRYCGNDNVPLTVDHLVCWEAGGPSTVENLVSACRKCNKTRGDMTYQDWLQHPFYLKVSKNLSPAELEANRKIVETLWSIPLTVHKRSR